MSAWFVRLQTRPELAVAAVLAPSGKFLDIDGDPLPGHRCEALSARVLAVEGARLRRRRHEPEAFADWRALVEGRYSGVRREDSDGKRYNLLIANSPFARENARFSRREVDVVRMDQKLWIYPHLLRHLPARIPPSVLLPRAPSSWPP